MIRTQKKTKQKNKRTNPGNYVNESLTYLLLFFNHSNDCNLATKSRTMTKPERVDLNEFSMHSKLTYWRSGQNDESVSFKLLHDGHIFFSWMCSGFMRKSWVQFTE